MTDYELTACPEQEARLHLYLDGELSPAEQEALLAHLRQCQGCRTRLAELQTLFAELTSLEEVAAPPELVSQVMANLPATNGRSRPGLVGQFALAGQVIIGLALLLLARPVVATALDHQVVQQPWLILTDITTSSAAWLIDLGVNLSQRLPSQWPSTGAFIGLDISLGMGLAIVASLSLAWLIGNTVLLRHPPTSLKNGT